MYAPAKANKGEQARIGLCDELDARTLVRITLEGHMHIERGLGDRLLTYGLC
jgi:hypothetical protein